MMETKRETTTEAVDSASLLAYRIRGLAYAADSLLDPVSGDPENTESHFAARMAMETIQDYASEIIAAIERLARHPGAAA